MPMLMHSRFEFCDELYVYIDPKQLIVCFIHFSFLFLLFLTSVCRLQCGCSGVSCFGVCWLV